jgi:hypothetical protein
MDTTNNDKIKQERAQQLVGAFFEVKWINRAYRIQQQQAGFSAVL